MRWVIALIALLLTGCLGEAEVLVYETGAVGPAPTSTAEAFVAQVALDDRRLGVSAEVELTSGEGSVRLAPGDGEPLFDESFGPKHNKSVVVLPPLGEAEPLEGTVELEAAVGSWEVAVVRVPAPSSFYVFLAAGPLVLLVLGLGLWLVRRRYPARLRWLWIGAGLWFVALVLKVTSDGLLTESVLAGLERLLPRAGYLTAGSLYYGLHSAVYEMGLTVLAALIWRQLREGPHRAMSIGLGAGSLEALLIGIFSLVSAIQILRGSPSLTVDASYAAAMTPAVWLMASVERALAIPLHVASRALLLHGMATRHWKSLLLGFSLFALNDAVGAALMVAELKGKICLWWGVLGVLPFGLFSLWVVFRLARTWPAAGLAESSG